MTMEQSEGVRVDRSPARAVAGEVVVLGDLLDGGPVLCGCCVTAWRPATRCPNCGCTFTGAERGTGRARAIYRAQRDDAAPWPGGAGWLAYLAGKGLVP